MKRIKNPLRSIRQNKREAIVKWASQSFAGGGTFRMFAKGHTGKIREFLHDEIADCQRLAKARTQKEYDKELGRLISRFRTRVRLNRNSGKRANFGQAAKVINLYVKQFLLFPDFMSFPCAKKRLYQWAHVPLDRIVLGYMAEDFSTEMREAGITRKPALRNLNKKSYKKLQDILAHAARRERMPRLAYDFRWPYGER